MGIGRESWSLRGINARVVGTPGLAFSWERKPMPIEAAAAKKSRAQWEAFEYRVPVPGRVRIENTSYGDDSNNHVYVVTIEDGATTSCTCPSDEYQPGQCKHRIGVENQPAVLLAASQ
jgi:hypothetical protein